MRHSPDETTLHGDGILRLTACLAVLVISPWPLSAASLHESLGRQTSAEAEATPASSADSTDARRRAERAFQLYRERVLSALSGPESDVLVRTPTSGLMPPERQREIYLDEATRRRPGVIETLDEVASVIPGDDWVTGFRVVFRIKQGQVGEALEAARDCQGRAWWCDALLAWTLHLDGQAAEAERAVEASLAGMTSDQYCEWSGEVGEIIHGALGDALASCESRRSLMERLWWLADPLHVRAGNERKVEHFVRVLAMGYHHGPDYRRLVGGRCDPGHHSRMIQGGWPPWWFALPIALDPVPSGQAFLPSDATWSDPLQHSDARDWDISVRRYGERYMPSYGAISPIPQQTAFFLRGDSLLVAASLGLVDRMLVAGVALSTSEREPPMTALVTDASGPFRVERRVPRERYLVSVEAVAPGGGAHRARFGHGLPDPGEGGLQMSDVMLFRWADGLEHDYEAVFPHMLGTDRVRRGEPLGVYWETYGLEEGRAVEVRVQLGRTDPGLFRRLGEALRLVDAQGPVSVRWTVPDEDVQVGRHMRLDFGSQSPGRYELLLEVEDGEGGRASASRTIEIVDA